MGSSSRGNTQVIQNKQEIVVPGGGVEPPRTEVRRILSPLRLPVPPSRHFVEVIDFKYSSLFLFFLPPNNKCKTVQPLFEDLHSPTSLCR
jgi:hypothetical protein